MSPMYWEPQPPAPERFPLPPQATHSRRMDRVKDWALVILMGMGIGLVVGLLFTGCNNPAAPSSTPRKAVHPIPLVVPQ